MTNRTRSATLLGAACLVAVAGCGSDPKPKVLPSLSSTPSTTATSTTSPGSVEAEVEAAVRHYFDVATKAFSSGHTAELASLSIPGCGCRKLVDGIKAMNTQGHHAVGIAYIVDTVRVHDVIGDTAAAEVTFHVPPYTELDDSGSEIARHERHDSRDDLSLTRSGSRWLITNAVKLESSS
jgi:hypothetical protein